MYAVRTVIAYSLLELSFIILEFGIFTYLGPSQYKVPLILVSILVLILMIVTGMALFVSIKHHKDKEPW
jgi:hypothetical protein